MADRKSYPPPKQMADRKSYPPPNQMAGRKSYPPPNQMADWKSYPPPNQMADWKSYPPPNQMAGRKSYPPPNQMADRKSYPPPNQMADRKSYPPPNQIADKKTYQPPRQMADKKSYQPPRHMADKKSYEPPRHMADKKSYQPLKQPVPGSTPYMDYHKKMSSEQRKVLEDIQRTKRLLKEGAAASLGMHTTPTPTPSGSLGFPPQTSAGIGDMMMTPGMRSAMQVLGQANMTSFGWFVPQDSHFGNSILPVLPRLDPPPTSAQTQSPVVSTTAPAPGSSDT